MYYAENKTKARTFNKGIPTRTDQSQSKDTDINIILKKFAISGRAPGAAGQPIHGDFTKLPTDLRGYFDTAHDLRNLHRSLPKELRSLSTEELLSLTTEQINKKLTPRENNNLENPKETPPTS